MVLRTFFILVRAEMQSEPCLEKGDRLACSLPMKMKAPQMKVPHLIDVPSIPDEGLSVDLDSSVGWFRGLLTEKLSQFHPLQEGARGNLTVIRTGENVSVNGEMNLELTPDCGRCGVNFRSVLNIPILRHLAPYFDHGDKKLAEDEEIELNADDLEFSFYDNEEINLSQILSEEVLLALPMNFICKEDCRGLCPQCGVDLNQKTCACGPNLEASPFAVLKDLKFDIPKLKK